MLAAVTLGAAFCAPAQTSPASDAGHSAQHPAQAATAPQSDGEVRKVDKEQGKITLRHGPLQNLDMPAMTMVFKVADPKVLAA
jgi:Cu/Ag efflux protein CusF